MEFAFILLAFVFGFVLKLLRLPTLIGYLLAGFTLNFFDFTVTQALQNIANFGITLMLFTIGLKLNVKDLYKKEVWIGSISHTVIWITTLNLLLICCSWFGLSAFANLEWTTQALLAFSLSFSSTVCIVKILEESGEIKTRHGKLAIGILVMQDIIAVLFLVIATGKIPSIWACSLILLFFIKPIWSRILDAVGHGELLILSGFMFAFGGYELFELVGIKGDLGALIIGMFVATHSKSTELSKSLMSFKDLFLIGFFLTIGMSELPTFELTLTALILCLFIPVKFVLFFKIFSLLRLRARTSYLASLVLSNYSEFGLIVVALLVNLNWLPKEWLVVLALAVSFSFVFTSFIYKNSHNQYNDLKLKLKSFEHNQRLPEDTFVQPDHAEIIVIGLGRVGKGAYLSLHQMVGNKVWGMDADPVRINTLKNKGYQVLIGDGEDVDLWENMDLSGVNLVLLALPSIDDICNITEQLHHANFSGKIASIARYEDQIEPLLKAGSDKVFNFFTEAGTGFAEESLQLILNKDSN